MQWKGNEWRWGVVVVASILSPRLISYVYDRYTHLTLDSLALPCPRLEPMHSFTSVFRTNTAYQRWDEARKNWGMNMYVRSRTDWIMCFARIGRLCPVISRSSFLVIDHDDDDDADADMCGGDELIVTVFTFFDGFHDCRDSDITSCRCWGPARTLASSSITLTPLFGSFPLPLV
jgi:Bestrophin, RFP-TM, chloride channel